MASKGGRWSHPWKCGFSVDQVSIRLGLVNGLEPYLDGRLMSGKDAEGNADPKGVPVLRLKAEEYDDTGRSFICIRIRLNEGGKILEDEYTADDLRIIQSKTRILAPGREGQHVIAVLRRPKGDSGFGTLKQVGMHDYQHGFSRAGTTPEEKGVFRHWFFPA